MFYHSSFTILLLILTSWKNGSAEYFKGNCDPDEVFKYGPPYDTTCETLGVPRPIVDVAYVEMCYCVDGYARNDLGVCIPIKQCPLKKCDVNQIYNLCPPSCPPETTCETYRQEIFCHPDLETRFCIPRCECKSGFIRMNTNGLCIKPEKCLNREIYDINEIPKEG